jgi:hypothetical protein
MTKQNAAMALDRLIRTGLVSETNERDPNTGRSVLRLALEEVSSSPDG